MFDRGEIGVHCALLASPGVSTHPEQIASRGPSTEGVLNAALEAARPERHVSWLDIGCGRGDLFENHGQMDVAREAEVAPTGLPSASLIVATRAPRRRLRLEGGIICQVRERE
jgi:hypothetical protein